MSLILEALKKLEREKQSPDRGFLVLGPGAWSGAPGGRWGMALALAGAVLLGAAAGTAFWRAREPGPAVPPSAPASVAAAAPETVVPPITPPPSAHEPPGAPRPAPAVSVMPVHAPALVPESREARDETAPPSEQAPSAPEAAPRFQLQAISRRDGRLVAVLSGRLVFEGDSFEGVRVLRIGDAEVELEVDGRREVIGF